jgi:predicted transcriptional regulator
MHLKNERMFDWHKAYESQDLKDVVTLFLDSGLRRECGIRIAEMLLNKPNSRRGAIIEALLKEDFSKATIERTLKDLETIGLISSEGKYLKTGRYRLNFTRFSSALARLSRTVKKVEQNATGYQSQLKNTNNSNLKDND